MKKIIFLLFICCLFTKHSFANELFLSDGEHSKYQIGLWGGLTSAGLATEGNLLTFGPFDENKSGLSAGVTVGTFLWNFISVESGLFFSQLGGRGVTQAHTDDQGTKLGEFYFSQDMRYLEIPVSFKINLNEKFLNSFLLVGPNFGFLRSAHEKFESDYDSDFSWNEDYKDNISSLNVGLDIGFGVKYPVKNNVKFSLTGKYTIGLSNQIKDGSDLSQKSRDFKVYAGIVFGL